MTLELLKAGLQKLIDDGQLIDESKKAIAEIEEVQRLAAPDDIFKGECYVLHSTTVSGLLNIATYDAYGKLYVEYNGDVARGDYEAVIRRMYECDCLPNSAVELGYDIISDLYSDNEALGCHRPDGTFIHASTTTEFEHLKNFCDFIAIREQLADFDTEFGPGEAKRLFGEHLYNLMLDAGVAEPLANDISDKLEAAYYN